MTTTVKIAEVIALLLTFLVSIYMYSQARSMRREFTRDVGRMRSDVLTKCHEMLGHIKDRFPFVPPPLRLVEVIISGQTLEHHYQEGHVVIPFSLGVIVNVDTDNTANFIPQCNCRVERIQLKGEPGWGIVSAVGGQTPLMIGNGLSTDITCRYTTQIGDCIKVIVEKVGDE